MTITIDRIAARTAARIVREGALRDDWRAEKALIAEAENAGISDPAAVAEVGRRAALILTQQARQAFDHRRAA